MARQRIRYFQNAALDATIYDFTFKAPKTFNALGGAWADRWRFRRLGWLKDRTFFLPDMRATARHSRIRRTAGADSGGAHGRSERSVNAPGQGAPVNNPFTGTAYATTPFRRSAPGSDVALVLSAAQRERERL